MIKLPNGHSLIGLLIAVLLTGCSSWTRQMPTELPLFRVQLADMPAAQYQQRVRMEFTSTTAQPLPSQDMIAAWSVREGGLDLVAMSTTGQVLMQLQLTGEGLQQQYSPLLKIQLPARDILSQLQLAHWPIAALQKELTGTDWHLAVEQQQRQLFFRRQLVLTIDREPVLGPVDTAEETLTDIAITHHLMHYSLLISTLQYEPLH